MSGLERAHRDALRKRMLSEQRLREELLRWRHHHPEVRGRKKPGGIKVVVDSEVCATHAFGAMDLD